MDIIQYNLYNAMHEFVTVLDNPPCHACYFCLILMNQIIVIFGESLRFRIANHSELSKGSLFCNWGVGGGGAGSIVFFGNTVINIRPDRQVQTGSSKYFILDFCSELLLSVVSGIGMPFPLQLTEHGQPDQIVKSLVPQRNSLVFFEVTPVSFHQVCKLKIAVYFVDSTYQCRYSGSSLHGRSRKRTAYKKKTYHISKAAFQGCRFSFKAVITNFTFKFA